MAFEYKPFINPYIGSISELMGKGDQAKAEALLRIGEIQARAAEQQGQAWGNAIQGLGNIAGKAFTDYAQEKKDAPIRAAEAAHREALGAADIFAAEQTTRTRALQGRQDTARELYNQRLSGTMPSPIGPVPMMRREQAPAGVAEDGTPRLPSSNLVQEPHPFQIKQNGAWVYDIEKYKQAAAVAGVAVESDPFFQAMSETNQLRQDTQAKAGVQAKQQAGLLLGMPDAQLMQNAPAAVNALRGLYNDDVLDSFMALHKSGDVPQIRAALGRLAGAKYETPVVPGQTLQSQFGDTQTTPGTPPVQIEGNPFPMMENGQEVYAVRVKTANGGSEFRHVDGVTPFTGTLTGMPGKQEDVMRGGQRTPILEGTRRPGDLPVPTPQAPQAPSWDVLTDPTGKQRYVAKGSQAAADLMQQGWKAGSAAGAKPPTGVQSKTLGFFTRMDNANKDLESVEDTINKMGTLGVAWMNNMPNFLQGEAQQLYAQAQRAFTETRLRKDSGAAIPEYEFANDRRMAFAQPGDGLKNLEQKRRYRQNVMSGLAFESGPALKAYYGDDAADEIVQRLKPQEPLNTKAAAALKAAGRDASPESIKAFLAANPGFR